MSKLNELFESGEFDDLPEMTPKEKELHDKLFNSERLEVFKKNKQTLGQSMAILYSGERNK